MPRIHFRQATLQVVSSKFSFYYCKVISKPLNFGSIKYWFFRTKNYLVVATFVTMSFSSHSNDATIFKS